MVDLDHKPLLTGHKVILRPFKSEDFPFIEECLKDPEVVKLTGSSSDFDREVTLRWYNTIQEMNKLIAWI